MKRALALLALLLGGTVDADTLPAGAVRRLGTTQFRVGAGQEIPTLAYSSDGKLLAVSGGRNGTIHLLDAESGEVRRRLPNRYSGPVHALAFAPDGKILVAHYSGGLESWLAFWKLDADEGSRPARAFHGKPDPTINQENHWMQVAHGRERPLRTWSFSPDSRFLAVTDGHRIRIVEVKAWREVGSLYSTRQATALALFSGGKRVAVGRDDGTIRIYDVASGISRRELGPRGKAEIYSLALSAHDTHLAAAGGDHPARLWTLAEDKDAPLKFEAAGAGDVRFDPDGKTLTVTSWDKTYRIFAISSGKRLHEFALKTEQVPMALSPDGKTLAWLGDRLVRRIDTATGKERALAVGHEDAVRALTFSRDGKRLDALHDRTWLTWDTASGKLLNTRETTEPVPDPSLGGDLSVEPGQLKHTKGRKKSIVTLGDFVFGGSTFSPDRRRVALFGQDDTDGFQLRLVEVVTGRRQMSLRLQAALTESELKELRQAKLQPVLAFSPDGRLVAVALPFGSIHVYDLLCRQRLFHFAGHAGSTVASLAFSPDGRLLASGSDDTSTLLWDLGPKAKAAEVNAATLTRLWSDLASDDAATAHDAMAAFREHGKASVAFLRDQLLKESDPEAIKRRIALLDRDEFTIRQRAETELDAMRELATPLLRETVRVPPPSLEVRRRVERILNRLDPGNLSAGGRRAERAIAALECIGTPEAKAALEAVRRQRPTGPLSRAVEDAERRLAGKPAPLPFAAALADERLDVRVAAARGLAILGDFSDDVLHLLLKSMNDPTTEVRRQVVEILSYSPRDPDGKVVEALTRALDDPSNEVATEAFDGLVRWRRYDDAALRKMAKEHANAVVRERAAETLRAKEESERAARRDAEDNRLEEIRRRAREETAAKKMAKMERMRVEPLMERMKGKDDREGFAAAQTLAKREGQAVPYLLDLLGGTNERARERAAFALGHIGAPAREATPELIKALQSKEVAVRRRAADALAQIGPYSDKETAAALIVSLADDDAEVRIHLAEALARLGRTAAPPLIEALKDADKRVRRGAAEALGNIDPRLKLALPALREALKDTDGDVRKAVQEAIDNIERANP
jgi:WD40 repeat protein/HEAT repeat protein